MYSRFSIYIILTSIIIALTSCGRNNPDSVVANRPGAGEMEELNRHLVRKDRERIINYIERKGLQMTESPTGMWYQIIKEGDGDCLKENMRVTMEYECLLLDGTICYSSAESGPKELVLGRTGIEPGLYEGLRLLKAGGEGIFILPPFLAHGLPGDGKKIPPRSVIIYRVNILRTG